MEVRKRLAYIEDVRAFGTFFLLFSDSLELIGHHLSIGQRAFITHTLLSRYCELLIDTEYKDLAHITQIANRTTKTSSTCTTIERLQAKGQQLRLRRYVFRRHDLVPG